MAVTAVDSEAARMQIEPSGHRVALETRSIVDALRSEIQSQILGGARPPGTAFTEMSVAQTFDVARPTAKAAIEQLVHLGLLRRLRNKTAQIPLLDVADVADLYLSRSVIECAIVCLLAERREVPRDAVGALDRFRAAIASGDKVPELVESDIEFHRALVAGSRSPRLCRLHEIVIGEAHLCMAQIQTHHLLHAQVIADEHERILATIKGGHVDRAATEVNAHLFHAANRLIAYLQGEEDRACERQDSRIANGPQPWLLSAQSAGSGTGSAKASYPGAVRMTVPQKEEHK